MDGIFPFLVQKTSVATPVFDSLVVTCICQ
jgi:hypothetical protein